jgi:hypothetical protein
MPTITEWYHALPVISKFWLSGAAAAALATYTGALSPRTLLWDPYSVLNDYQLYRLLSPFYLGPLSLPFLINMFTLSQSAVAVEQSQSHPASFLYMLLLLFAGTGALSFFLPVLLPGLSLMFAVMHIWGRANADRNVNFMFGIQFPAAYLAMVWGLLSGLQGDWIHPIVGILLGQAYHLKQQDIRTPLWLIRLVQCLPPHLLYPQGANATRGGAVYTANNMNLNRYGGPRSTGTSGSQPRPGSSSTPSQQPPTSSSSGGSYFSGRGRVLGSS